MPPHKLILLFHSPLPPNFEQRWSEHFVPLAEKLPGLRRVVVSHTQGGPAGPVEIYLVHELHFDSLEALKAAMLAPEGLAAGQALVKLAGKQATLMFAEHMEDVPNPAK